MRGGVVSLDGSGAVPWPTALRVGEPRATVSQLLTKNTILGLQIVDYIVLVTIHPSG